MSVYTYQTMLLRKFYKFIKFKTVSKMFAANSPYVGPDSTRRAKFECGFQHWTIMSSNLTKSQSHNALASLVHAMVKKQCYIPALMNKPMGFHLQRKHLFNKSSANSDLSFTK